MTQDTIDTRQRVLESALEVFARHGYDGATTRLLATACGLNLATLNYHFGGKDALYRETMRESHRRLQGSMERVVPGLVGQPLRTVVSSLVEMARAQQVSVRLYLREVMDLGHLRTETEQEHFLPMLARYAPLVAGGLGLSEALARQLMVTASFLVARFAVQSEASLISAFGVTTATEAHEAVVDSLYRVVRSYMEEG